MTLVIILARLNSSRLPKKHFKEINSKPLIFHILSRLNNLKNKVKIVLATGPKKENLPLAKYLEKFQIDTFFDNDVDDVTGRITRCAQKYNLNKIVTVSGDCPLIDPEFIDEGIELLRNFKCDYVYVNKKKYKCIHEGLSFRTLFCWEIINENSKTWFHKEHPGSVLNDIKSRLFGVEIIPKKIYQREDFRMSVDTISDLRFINELYERLQHGAEILDLRDVVNLIDQCPELKLINSHVHQKKLKEKSENIIFITNSSKEIGMGHLSRSITIAKELQERFPIKVTFLVDNKESQEILSTRGFHAEFGFSDFVKGFFKATFKIDAIGYILDLKLDSLKTFDFLLKDENYKTILIDHHNHKRYLNNISIIPALNINSKRLAKTRIGKEFLVLDRFISYMRISNLKKKKIQSLVVLSGGSSLPDIDLIESLSEISKEIKINFIVGPFADLFMLNQSISENYSQFEIYQNPKNFLSIINSSEIVITPFGVSAYEALALKKIVIINKIIDPNDKKFVDFLHEKLIAIRAIGTNNISEIVKKAMRGHIKLDHNYINPLSIINVTDQIVAFLNEKK